MASGRGGREPAALLRARLAATLLCVFLKIELVRDCAKLATSCFVAPEFVLRVRIIAASLEAGAGTLAAAAKGPSLAARAADKSRGTTAGGVLLAAGGSSSAGCTFGAPSLAAGAARAPEEPLLAGRSCSPTGCAWGVSPTTADVSASACWSACASGGRTADETSLVASSSAPNTAASEAPSSCGCASEDLLLAARACSSDGCAAAAPSPATTGTASAGRSSGSPSPAGSSSFCGRAAEDLWLPTRACRSSGGTTEDVFFATGGCSLGVPSPTAEGVRTPEEPLLAGRAGCAAEDFLLAASGCSPAGCAAEDFLLAASGYPPAGCAAEDLPLATPGATPTTEDTSLAEGLSTST